MPDETTFSRRTRPTVRVERRYPHPIEKVWLAVTTSEHLGAWFPSPVEIDLRPGGAMRFSAFEGDDGATGSVEEVDAPRRLTFTWGTDRMTFELEPDGDGTVLRFIARSPVPDDFLSKVQAGWHFHLDALADFVDDGTRIDWPNWPLDRWQAIHDTYYSGELDSERQSSRQAAER